MSQNEQGMLYPFRLSGSRMRRSAAQLRRQGNPLDALALVRRAAQQEDTPAAWHALAAELRLSGNWEAAVQLLARTLSRDPHQPGAWLELARCLYALDQKELAADCACHQLQEDPWSADGERARQLLAEADAPRDAREPRRLQRLIHRGMSAWQSGDREAGERCIRRALRITRDKSRLLVTTAMLCMLEMDFDGALSYLPRALRYDPTDARTLTALATLYHQLGKRRISRGFLQQAGKHAESVMAEDGFLSAAWAQDAWEDLEHYLNIRMKRQPHRIALLSAKATMCCELGDMAQARQLWREIVSIDPDDRHAVTMLTWSQEQPEAFIHVPGMLPRGERARQMADLERAVCTLAPQALLAPGGRARQLMDWAINSTDPAERRLAMQLLTEADAPELIPYMKELLCRPFLRMEVRQWALVRLAQMGCRDEMLMMAGGHYSLVQCQPVTEEKSNHSWQRFLTGFLRETRRYGMPHELAEFAAALWRTMTGEQRREASEENCFLWCKAMEIHWLRMCGDTPRADRLLLETPLSSRRIGRVMRRIAANFAPESQTE